MAKPTIIKCPNCGTKNRVRPSAEGVPRCSVCHTVLPWIVETEADGFAPAELVARVDAVLRRTREDDGAGTPLCFGELEIDPSARSVAVAGREVELTQREFDLLHFLAIHSGQVFSREQLMDQVWRFPFYTDVTTVTVHIRRVRAKIEPDPSAPRFVETVWGVGYRFRPEAR